MIELKFFFARFDLSESVLPYTYPVTLCFSHPDAGRTGQGQATGHCHGNSVFQTLLCKVIANSRSFIHNRTRKNILGCAAFDEVCVVTKFKQSTQNLYSQNRDLKSFLLSNTCYSMDDDIKTILGIFSSQFMEAFN